MRQKLVPKATSDLREVSRNHREAMLHGQSADPPGTGSITGIDTQELKTSKVSTRSGCGQQDSGSHTPTYTGIQGQSGEEVQHSLGTIGREQLGGWSRTLCRCGRLLQKAAACWTYRRHLIFLSLMHHKWRAIAESWASRPKGSLPIYLPDMTKGTKGQYWKAGTHVPWKLLLRSVKNAARFRFSSFCKEHCRTQESTEETTDNYGDPLSTVVPETQPNRELV